MFKQLRFLYSVVFATTISSILWAQDTNKISPLANVRPDMIVTAREHPMGPEIVQINMVNGHYPKDLFVKQVNAFAAALGSEARGLHITMANLGAKTDMGFLRADFAVDHMIEGGSIRIEPLIKAFAGSPEPYTVKGIKILLENIKASPSQVQRFSIPGVIEAQGTASVAPPGLEYQIQLLSQDASQLKFPERYNAPFTSQKETKSASTGGTNPGTIIALFAVAGVALGALVYLVLMRSSSSKSR